MAVTTTTKTSTPIVTEIGGSTQTATEVQGDINKLINEITNQTTLESGSSRTYTQNMDSASLAALTALITQLQGGGTQEQKKGAAQVDQTTQLIQALLGQVSQGQAFKDAEGMMNLLLAQAAERSGPAIQRAIEGAGTSASSMQAVLSQRASRDAAIAGGAAGTQQSAIYAQQRTGLAGVLENLAGKGSNDAATALINALQVAKGATTDVTSTFNRTGQVTGNLNRTELTTQAPSVTTTVNTGRTETQTGGDTTETKIAPETAQEKADRLNSSNAGATWMPIFGWTKNSRRWDIATGDYA